jgi:hypothetical protein
MLEQILFIRHEIMLITTNINMNSRLLIFYLFLLSLSLVNSRVELVRNPVRVIDTQSSHHVPTGFDPGFGNHQEQVHDLLLTHPGILRLPTTHPSSPSQPTFSLHVPRSLLAKPPSGPPAKLFYRPIAAPHLAASRRPAPHRLARQTAALGPNDEDRNSEARMRERLEEIVKVSPAAKSPSAQDRTRMRMERIASQAYTLPGSQELLLEHITAKAFWEKQAHCARLTVRVTGMCTGCCLLVVGVINNEPDQAVLGLGNTVVGARLAWDSLRKVRSLGKRLAAFQLFLRWNREGDWGQF